MMESVPPPLHRPHPFSALRWLETLLQDVRLALRLLRRTPALTCTALLSIAVTVAATAVVFAAVKSVLLNPLPYRDVDRLMQLRSVIHLRPADEVSGQSHSDWIFLGDAREVVRRTRTLQAVGIFSNAVLDLAGGPATPPEALYGLRVSASLFPTLGVSPMLGRNILAEEEQPHHPEEIILSYGLWVRRFDRDRNIVGRTITMNRKQCLVIGVMPADFNFPLRRAAAHTPQPYVEFWAPLRIEGPEADAGALGAVARLRPGISVAQAQQDLASIGDALARDFPSTNRDRTLRLSPLWDRTVGPARPALSLLTGAALLFLLIGCANVANLLLARGVVRTHEMATRVALGAGRSRLVRQLLTESCVLAALGGAGGYLLSIAAWKVLPSIAPLNVPRLAAAHADRTVLFFSIALALVNGILFGLAPALRAVALGRPATAGDLALRTAVASRKDRVRSSFIVGEVAISVILVLLGAQLLGTFLNLMHTDPGFRANHVLASVVLPEQGQYRTAFERATVYRRFLTAVREIRGVESAGTVDALPFSGENHGSFIKAGNDQGRLLAEADLIGGDYLQALGVHLLAGRWFREEETAKPGESVIVNDLVAKRLWPGDSAAALGRKICIDCTPENPANWKQVIGVVSSIRHAALDGPPPLNVYLAAHAFEEAAFLVVRTNRTEAEMDRAVRLAIARVDPNQAVLLSTSLQALVADSVADRRFLVSLLGATGCLALLMSIGGIFGVSLYVTSRRTQEIGVRMALGATSSNIHALVLRQGFSAVCAGLGIGSCLAVALMRILRGVIPGLGAGVDTAAIWTALSVVILASVLACWLPARRATGIDPMRSLRYE